MQRRRSGGGSRSLHFVDRPRTCVSIRAGLYIVRSMFRRARPHCMYSIYIEQVSPGWQVADIADLEVEITSYMFALLNHRT